VKTPGKMTATARTSNSTLCSRAKNAPYADNVGPASQTKKWSGELKMESFSLNCAKSFIGKNVNLHLKDGSVIINVHLKNIKKGNFGKGNFVEYMPYKNRKLTSISIRNVAWAEMLNVSLMDYAD
jgi:hypothetical protein